MQDPLALGLAADDPAVVLGALRAVDPRFRRRQASPCNWEHGIAAVFGRARPRGVFVTPPIEGHVLLVEYLPSGWEADPLDRFSAS
jgi:hypothetical protein